MSELAKIKIFLLEKKKFRCFLIPVKFSIKFQKCNYSNIGEEKENKFWHGNIVYDNGFKYLFWPIEVAIFCLKCENLVIRRIE